MSTTTNRSKDNVFANQVLHAVTGCLRNLAVCKAARESLCSLFLPQVSRLEVVLCCYSHSIATQPYSWILSSSLLSCNGRALVIIIILVLLLLLILMIRMLSQQQSSCHPPPPPHAQAASELLLHLSSTSNHTVTPKLIAALRLVTQGFYSSFLVFLIISIITIIKLVATPRLGMTSL